MWIQKILLIFTLGAAIISPISAQMGLKGESVTDFTLTDLSGTPHTLSDYSGKAVLLFLLTPG